MLLVKLRSDNDEAVLETEVQPTTLTVSTFKQRFSPLTGYRNCYNIQTNSFRQ